MTAPRRALAMCVLLASCGIALAQSPDLPRSAASRRAVADQMDEFLATHVLGPRFPRCIDREHGGYHVNYARDWSPTEDRSRFIVYEARVLWTAAMVARLRPATRAEYLGYARHGVRYLADVMWDRAGGGFHTYVELDGKPTRESGASRPVYGQAFAVYALAAAHAATGDQEALDLARKGWQWIESHYRESGALGYRSAVRADGTPFPRPADENAAARESIEGPASLRTMNDHIHLLEAYAELLRQWPDPRLRARTEALLVFVRDRLAVEPGCLYVALRADGRPVPGAVSFGHDVETAFLMIEAEDALGRAPSRATLRVARMLVDHALARGFDQARGQLFESGSAYGAPVDRSVQWWAQFEVWNALFLLDDVAGPSPGPYWDAGVRAWHLTRTAFADAQQPGVCPQMEADGSVRCDAKSHQWFASYHTARALLLSSDRLRGSGGAP